MIITRRMRSRRLKIALMIISAIAPPLRTAAPAVPLCGFVKTGIIVVGDLRVAPGRLVAIDGVGLLEAVGCRALQQTVIY